MRALMVTPLFFPHIGGVENHVYRVSKELINEGHQVDVLTLRHDQSLPDYEHYQGIDIWRMDGNRLMRAWGWQLAHSCLMDKADVIHCHDYCSFNDWILPLLPLRPKAKVYVTFHGHEGYYPIPRQIVLKRKLTERLTQNNICIGDFIPKWYGTVPGAVSYGGVDLPIEMPGEGRCSATFIGRLEKDTGILEYIEALRLLKEKGVEIPLDICGDGTLRKEVQSDIDKYRLNVHLHGFVSNPQDYLKKGSIAFVSGYLSILQAFAYRRQVFSIYDTPVKEDYLKMIPGSNKSMEIASSPEELAEKLLNRESTSKKMIEEGYAFAQAHTWDHVAKTYVSLWGWTNG